MNLLSFLPFFKKNKKNTNKPENNIKTPRNKQPKTRFPIPINSFIGKLISEFKQLWIQVPSPWRMNGDDYFVDQMWEDAVCSNALSVRSALSQPECTNHTWPSRLQLRFDEERRTKIEALLEELLSKIDMNSYYNLLFNAKICGMTGIDTELEYDSGLFYPIALYHYDTRRFIRNRQDGNKYKFYIKIPERLTEVELYGEDGSPTFPNMQIIRDNMLDSTLGYGRADGDKFYWAMRARLIIQNIVIVGIERFAFPYIVVSKDSELPYGNAPSIAGTDDGDVVNSVAEALNASAAGNIISITTPGVKVQLIEINPNKLAELRAWARHLGEECVSAILGTASVLLSDTKTYGALRAASLMVQAVVEQDRKFYSRMLKTQFYPIILRANKEAFAELGVYDINSLPNPDLISRELDPEAVIEKLKLALDYKLPIENEFIETVLGIDLKTESGIEDTIREKGDGDFIEDISGGSDA